MAHKSNQILSSMLQLRLWSPVWALGEILLSSPPEGGQKERSTMLDCTLPVLTPYQSQTTIDLFDCPVWSSEAGLLSHRAGVSFNTDVLQCTFNMIAHLWRPMYVQYGSQATGRPVNSSINMNTYRTSTAHWPNIFWNDVHLLFNGSSFVWHRPLW